MPRLAVSIPTGWREPRPQTLADPVAMLSGKGAPVTIGEEIEGEFMKNHGYLKLMLAAVLATGVMACEKKGPVEQAGEEIDEAVQTVKEGGESVGTKVDDAVDELRD
jgi:hypothetical protein